MLIGIALGGAELQAQLAITEVMSDASTNHGGIWGPKQSDFWELTNFGTNAIDLAGYSFADFPEQPVVPLLPPGDPPLTIGPGQSVIFVRFDTITNAAQFRTWWGECLDASVPVRMVPQTPGFDPLQDGLRLWDASSNLVDRVNFDVARQGVTFVSDPDTGEFGAFTMAEACGACQAATTDDLGSPGRACDPIPLSIGQQPANQIACAGTEATFTTRCVGLPRPKFQWFFKGDAIPGATEARYTVSNVQLTNAGAYHVVVTNGLNVVLSDSATLTVTTNPSPPAIVEAPVDAEVYMGQTAQFTITVCAYPPATYQWTSNGVPLAGQTDRVLTVPDCTEDMSGAHFCVRVANSLGEESACVRIVVTSKPKVGLSEVMAKAKTNCVQHADWFELTNFGTNSVNLGGYRFSDRPSLIGAGVITQTVMLQPGQSAILVEGMSAIQFRHWWGAGNLPPGLAIITYRGLGFADRGDEFYLWNAAATDIWDLVWSSSFELSREGVSLRFRFEEGDCYLGCESVVAEEGAFRAAECDDIGSPGYTTNGPPRLVSVAFEMAGARITWHGIEGKTYRLERNDMLQQAGWQRVGEVMAMDSLPVLTDTDAVLAGYRFYRVLELPP